MIGKKIRYLREQLDLSQSELAFRAEIHPTCISNYELDKVIPRLPQIKKLAAALGVKTQDLLAEDAGAMAEEIHQLQAELESYRSLGTIEDFSRLIQARDEDRILPMKDGDPVYLIFPTLTAGVHIQPEKFSPQLYASYKRLWDSRAFPTMEAAQAAAEAFDPNKAVF